MISKFKIKTDISNPFIILPSFINGKGPFDFVLDTGAAISIVSEEIGAVTGVRDLVAREGRGAGGKKVKVMVGEADTIQVGDLVVNNPKIGLMNQLPKCIGQGVLGYDFLKNYVLTIDYRNNELGILTSDNGQRNYTLPDSLIPFRLAKPDKPLILVEILVNEKQKYQFILDTGASQTVVSPSLAGEMGIKTGGHDALFGVGGNIMSLTGTARSFSAGKAHLTDVSVITSDIFKPLGEAISADVHGILGYNFLQMFRIVIDYPIGMLVFTQSEIY